MIVFLWLFRLMSHFSGELFFDPQGKLANFQIFGDFLDTLGFLSSKLVALWPKEAVCMISAL